MKNKTILDNNVVLTRYFRKVSGELPKAQQKTNRDVTVCGVINGNIMQINGTVCSSKQQFEKSLARRIAAGRATKKPCKTLDIEGLDKKQRIEIFVKTANELHTTFLGK